MNTRRRSHHLGRAECASRSLPPPRRRGFPKRGAPVENAAPPRECLCAAWRRHCR